MATQNVQTTQINSGAGAASARQSVDASAALNLSFRGWLRASWLRPAITLCADALALLLALSFISLQPPHRASILITPLATLVALLLFTLNGCYRTGQPPRPEVELERCVKAVTWFFVASSLAILLLRPELTLLVHAALASFATLTLLLVTRCTLRTLFAHLWRTGYARRRIVLIATPTFAMELNHRLAIQRDRSLEILVHLSPNAVDLTAWHAILDHAQAGAVLLDPIAAANPDLLPMLDYCRQARIDLELCSPLFCSTTIRHQIDCSTGSVRLIERSAPSLFLHKAAKSALDILIGLTGSLVALAMTPVVWILLRLEDPGPLFYHSEYLGCDGRIHHYLKFRTMIQNADSYLALHPELRRRFAEKQKLQDDPRVLRSGRFLRRFSLDEFPQFFNVLAGQLTFVGPRTIRMSEAARYGAFLERRLAMKPGLTGYWQVMGRQTTTYEDRISMDRFYCDNWSIWIDLVIIAQTFAMFFAQEGAY